jgi:hypothetical protein
LKPSLVEKALRRIPLPYPITSILIVVCVVIGLSFAKLADTGNLQIAFYYFSLNSESEVTFILGNFMLPIFALLSIRYMKDKIMSNDTGLIDICPEGKNTLFNCFKHTAQTLPVIGIAVLILVPTIINQNYSNMIVGPVTTMVYAVSAAIISLIYATFLWTYISLVYGIYQLGKYPLKLKPFYLENTLGLKPIGNLSLKMALVYFIGIFLILVQVFINPLIAISTFIEIGALIGLGVILFFMPLYTTHKRLIAEKKNYMDNLRSGLSNASFGIRGDDRTFEPFVENKATNLIAYDIIERKISLISDWPIDPIMVRTLTALCISTATTLVGRLILLFLGI